MKNYRCPGCEEEQDTIIQEVPILMSYEISVETGDTIKSTEGELFGADPQVQYRCHRCPECGFIFDKDGELIDELRTEDII
jgi:hypothetical protein